MSGLTSLECPQRLQPEGYRHSRSQGLWPYFEYGTFFRKLCHAVAKKILFAFNELQGKLLVRHLDSELAAGWR